MIVPHAIIRERVLELYRSGGLPRGDLTGWPSVDKLYTVGMNQWTLVTGTPNSGKSEWVDALMVNLAKQGRWKFFIYSPENHPLEMHHAKIIEKYLGKPFDPGPTKRADEEEVEAAEAWIHGKFHFCKPDAPNIESILAEGISSIAAAGSAWKTGIVIDPWNYLEHHRPQFMSETEYVSEILSRVIAQVREFPVHLWLVAHPAKQTPRKDGSYAVPTPRDVSGSAHFWNKSDNCVTIWRDQQEDRPEYRDRIEVHVQKIRFKHIGRIGHCQLVYNRVTGVYSEPKPEIRAVARLPHAD